MLFQYGLCYAMEDERPHDAAKSIKNTLRRHRDRPSFSAWLITALINDPKKKVSQEFYQTLLTTFREKFRPHFTLSYAEMITWGMLPKGNGKKTKNAFCRSVQQQIGPIFKKEDTPTGDTEVTVTSVWQALLRKFSGKTLPKDDANCVAPEEPPTNPTNAIELDSQSQQSQSDDGIRFVKCDGGVFIHMGSLKKFSHVIVDLNSGGLNCCFCNEKRSVDDVDESKHKKKKKKLI